MADHPPNPNVPHSAPQTAAANGIRLVYDIFGQREDPPVLLVAGLGAPMISWDDDFCRQLAARGFRVVRYDQRDTGLSTHLDDAGTLPTLELAGAYLEHRRLDAPYTLGDLADDAVALLDALELPSAHWIGHSMGGMVAQHAAVDHPARLRSLACISSSTMDPTAPLPRAEAAEILFRTPPRDRESYIAHALESYERLRGPNYPDSEERLRRRAAARFDRGLYPAGANRHLAAIAASGDRLEALRQLDLPTLVIHGDADPLLPVEGGRKIAEAIPGAQLVILEGLGHVLPPAAWPEMLAAIEAHIRRAEA